MKKSLTGCFTALLTVVAASAALADDDGSSLWGWNVSAGGNFGFGLKANLKSSPANAMRRLPALAPPVTGPSRATATAASTPVPGGNRVVYDADNGYFVDPSSAWGATPGHESETWNWVLPDSAVQGTGANRAFVMSGDGGAWGEVVSSSERVRSVDGSDGDVAYGASVDLSHALWMSEDGTWGVDVAIGLTWLKSFDCFRSSGVAVTRSTTIERGDTQTVIPGGFFAGGTAVAEDDGTWGNGSYDGDAETSPGSGVLREQYLINVNDIRTTPRVLSHRSYADSVYLDARGDYEEWEISVLLKPWYDVTDWLCLHGAIGMGITRSSFDYALVATSGGSSIYRSSEEFHEWRCYGIAGGGVLLRAGDWDFSCDGLFRFLQKDMEINGQDVTGTLEKPWAGLRLGVSYAF